MNLTALQNDVLSLLNEASNSTAGDLVSGAGGASTITTTAQITTLLNDAANDLCRRCWRLDDTGTYTVPIGTSFVPFSALTTGAGNTLRGVRTVTYNAIPLKEYDESHLQNRYGTYGSDAAGTPLFFYRKGDSGIGLYPAPSASETLTVRGVCTPAPLVNATDVPSWLSSDKHKLLSRYAAKEIAKKNAEDVNLLPRASIWEEEYEQAVMTMLTQLRQNDPYTAQAHFPFPPTGKS